MSALYGGVMVDEGEARRQVEAAVASWPLPGSEPDEEVVVWKVEDQSRAWIVHVATRRWLKTRDMRDQLVGACPFVIDKSTGELHLFGSAEYEKFQAWRD